MTDEITLLTFALEPVHYAISIRQVREVVPLPELTPLADAPPFVRGVFNLRGKVVTAIDLRQRLELPRRAWDRKTAVLIVPFEGKLFGLIVDQALSLVQLSAQQIEPAPDFSPFLGSRQGQFLRDRRLYRWGRRSRRCLGDGETRLFRRLRRRPVRPSRCGGGCPWRRARSTADRRCSESRTLRRGRFLNRRR